MGRPGCWEVRLPAVKQGGVEDGAFAVERGGGGGQGGGSAGGYFQDCDFGARAGGLLQQEAVDAVAAEPTVDEAEGAQGACHFVRGAGVFVEPLVGWFAGEGHGVSPDSAFHSRTV
jgi:hypothetical protein